MANFEPAFEKTMIAEGGFKLTNITSDRGGQTYAGITRRAHPNWIGWQHIDAGRVPPTSAVRNLYQLVYWDTMLGNSIFHQSVAESMYDFGVNAGTKTAVKLAQVVAGTNPDGQMGPKTLAAINAIDPAHFAPVFALAKVARYYEICKRDRTQEKFLMGWISRTLRGASQ